MQNNQRNLIAFIVVAGITIVSVAGSVIWATKSRDDVMRQARDGTPQTTPVAPAGAVSHR